MKLRISPLFQSNVQFGSYERTVYVSDTNDSDILTAYGEHDEIPPSGYRFAWRNDTSFFRGDLSSHEDFTWKKFRKFIKNFYKDAPKVNVYNFASSNGAEAYSFIVSMIMESGLEGAQKFFPVKAYDIDPYIIEQAKEGLMGADYMDVHNIDGNTDNNFSTYFNISKKQNYKPFLYVSPNAKIKNHVEFQIADVLDEIENVDTHNSVMMCRNFWPYLSEEDREVLVSKLSDVMDETSLLVIGGYDVKEAGIDSMLEENGFKEVSKLVYTKAA